MKELVATEFDRLLGGQLKIAPCTKTRGLPFLLRGLYHLCECEYNGSRFILMYHKGKTVYYLAVYRSLIPSIIRPLIGISSLSEIISFAQS